MDHDQFTEVRLEVVLAAGRALSVDTVLADATNALGSLVGEAEPSDAITCMVPFHGGCTPKARRPHNSHHLAATHWLSPVLNP